MDEFELTFLPKSLPDLLKSSCKEMLDIYIPSSSDHPYLRIRRNGETYEMTKKQPVQTGDASHQLETTISLNREEFDELAEVQGKRVSKRRYLYNEGDVAYEIDVFQEALKGLVLVDVEFSSLEEKNAYVAPEWLLLEVTQEQFLAGGMLCGKTYADIEGRLVGLGYIQR
ncbi:MAG: hypothetical protein Q8P93_02880 [bacterium]|nr:hypothetical protein [bacterium]